MVLPFPGDPVQLLRVSVARRWVRDVGHAAGGQGLISDRGFLTGARLPCSQLPQSPPSSHKDEPKRELSRENMCMREEMN